MVARTSLSFPFSKASSRKARCTAGTIAAGLLGLKAATALRPTADGPCEENEDFEKLPANLEDGLAGLEADREMRSLLGEDFVKVFTAVKRFELDRFHNHVSDWERDEYLEVY